MLRGAGVNVEKKGHEFHVSPLTDKHILDMSAGALQFAGRSPVRAKVGKSGEYEPMPGGLFDEKHTGGHGGTKWSHIALAEPLPNPLFQEPIKKLTGLTQKQFNSIIDGRAGVVPSSGEVTTSVAGVRGGAGIKALLDRIDVDKDLKKAKANLNSTSAGNVDRALKKVKYLTVLQDLKMKPSEAYILNHLPVMPPNTRPINQMDQAAIKYEDINGLYMKFAQINDKLKDPILSRNLTDVKKEEMRAAYYDGVKAIMGIGSVNKDKKEKGILETIAGSQPKEGYFQKTLVQRRQDMTMRSTIVPEPNLGLDEVGLPREAALTLFRPFVVRQLVQQGTATNVLDAQLKLSEVHRGKKDPMVWRALDHVMTERPVILKRDPALHKYSVQAFKAKTTDGNAIKIHPLVTGGFNADFDGDTMAVYVPISHEAVREAEKMYPTNNIFSESSGEVMYRPTLESALGLYKLSLLGKKTDRKFSDPASVTAALHAGKVSYTDIVHMGGKETTPGRVLLANVLPKPMQDKVLHDFDFKIDKHGLVSMLDTLGKDHRHDFGKVINDVKDMGYDASYGIIKTNLIPSKHLSIGTHTLSLKDFDPARSVRDPILKAAQTKVDAINASTTIPHNDKDRQSVNVWFRAGDEMQAQHKAESEEHPSNLYMMAAAGVKPSWDQYKQMVMSPLIMKDSKSQNIPTPIKNSYAEGLDLGEYWTQLHGARRGTVMKVQEVQEPGAMSKLLMNSSMNLMIDQHDCGTKKGISLSVTEGDVHDRHLAADFKSGGLHIPAGTLMTPDVIGQIRAVDKNAKILVRSPLKCSSEKGICQKCMGPSVDGEEHPFGTNVGIQAAHAVGERAVQLTLKSFHTGGVAEAGGGSKALNSFARFEQLTKLHKKIPNSATVAMASGKIDKIEKESTGTRIWVAGVPHFVGKDDNGLDLHIGLPGAIQPKGKPAWVPPSVGMHVEAGHSLSDPLRTVVNPHDLYKATKSMNQVQNHLASEIHDLYKDEGVRRRAVEVMVRAMSNLTKIEDPGDHAHLMRGEFYPTSVINHMNHELKEQGKEQVLHSPVLMGVDMLPLSLHDDWMARLQHQRLRTTIAEAAATGMVSSVHGRHPIPGVAFGAEFGLPRLARNVKGEPVVPSFVY
jgi:DNA-directed RNA polymerase subunit beta'